MHRILRLRRGNAAVTSTFVGRAGEVTIDTTNQVLVVHDGITPGGWPQGGQGSSIGNLSINNQTIYGTVVDGNIELAPNGNGRVILSNLAYPNTDGNAGQTLITDGNGNLYWSTPSSVTFSTTVPVNPHNGDIWVDSNTGIEYIYYTDDDSSQWVEFGPTNTQNDTVNFLALNTNVVPAVDSFYDLGTSSKQWRSLYVSGNTIYINQIPLTIDNSQNLLVNGNIIGGSQANLGNVGFDGDNIYDINGIRIVNNDLAHGGTAWVQIPANGGGDIQAANYYGNTIISSSLTGVQAMKSWTFGGDGTLTLPKINASGQTNAAWLQTTGNIIANANGALFIFADDNSLQFPDGSKQTTAFQLYVGNIAPTSTDRLWFNNEDGRTYVYNNGQWIDSNPQVPQILASIDNNGYSLALNANGSVTFPDGSVQTTAYNGGGNVNLGNFTFNQNTLYATAANTVIGTDFNTNPPGHTVTFQHNGGANGGSGGELKFDYGTAEIKVIRDAGTTYTWSFGPYGRLITPGVGIKMLAQGYGVPALGSSDNAKIVLYPQSDNPTLGDYALGIEAGALWNQVPDSGSSFKWYGGATQVLQLSGNGTLTLTNDLYFANGSKQSIAAMSFRGEWDSQGSYTGNVDVVTYNGGTYLKTSVDTNSGSSPDADAIRWQSIGSVGGNPFDQSLNTTDRPTFASVNFPTIGCNPPSTNGTRSDGTRLVLWPEIQVPGHADYAIGIDQYTIWNGVPYDNDGVSYYNFSWYAGTNKIMNLRGDGSLALVGIEDDATPVVDFFSNTGATGNHIVTLASDWTLKLKARAQGNNEGHLYLSAGAAGTRVQINGDASNIQLCASDGSSNVAWYEFDKTGKITLPDTTNIQHGFINGGLNNHTAGLATYSAWNQVYAQDTSVGVQTSSDGNTYNTWTFGNDGTFTLPADNQIQSLGGNNGLFLPANVSYAVELFSSGTGGLGLFAANAWITLDDGNNSKTGNVEILAGRNDTNKSWVFDNTGNLTLPVNGDILDANGHSVLGSLSGYATESYVANAVANVVNSAPGALDTLSELAAALGNDASYSTTISTALGNRLRFDINTQGLTNTQKTNAATNLGLANVATSGSYNDLSNTPSIPNAQIQSDWTQSNISSLDYIKNKPTLATVATSGAYTDLTGRPSLANVATSGSYTDLSSKPTIPNAQIQSDWTQSNIASLDYIKNKPTLATVATSGAYTDLTGRPTLANVATTGSYSDLSGRPTNVSSFTNDSGYLTDATLATSNTTVKTANVSLYGNITAVSTNSTFYPTFVSATTGNLALDVNSNFTYNPSTGNVSTSGDFVATGNVWANGGYFRTNASTAYIVNSTPTSVFIAGGATTGTTIGHSSGTVTINGNLQASTNGFAIGYRDIPQVSFTGNTTVSLSDAGKHYYSTQSTSYSLTVPNNSSTSFAIGSAINVVNQGTGNITITPGSGVTIYLAGNSTAGSRVLGSYGVATVQKVATDTWFVVGAGLT